MEGTAKAPCEACPCGCSKCAWDHQAAVIPLGSLRTVRTEAEYGCVKGGKIVVDRIRNAPLMQIGTAFHPLSGLFGAVIENTALERDIQMALNG